MTAQAEHSIVAEDLSFQYATLSDASLEILGGNMHVGYWHDADDDAPMNVATDRITDMLIDRINPSPGQRLLDVGCGCAGPAVRVARTRQVQVVGIDIGLHQLKLAKEHVGVSGFDEQVTIQFGDVNDMPFEDDSFDHAWSSECLIHVPDWTAAVRNIARVLRPGGRLVVGDCVERAPVDAQTRAMLDDYYTLVNCHYNKLDEIPGMVREAGLDLVELVEIGDHILERTMRAVEDGFHARAEQIEAISGMSADHVRLIGTSAVRFSDLPESGYAIMVAEKPQD